MLQPQQLFAGERDAAVPPANGEYLHARLPHSKLDSVESGHFVWEDAADQFAARIAAGVQGGYQHTGG